MNSPGRILRLWVKVVKKHEEGKKPDSFPKKGQEQKTRIKKGLTTLKLRANAPLQEDVPRKTFLKQRDGVGVILRNYCRYLKSSGDEDKKTLPKYLAMVKQVAVLVQKLNPDDPEIARDDDLPLENLNAVDTTALDKVLEGQDTEQEPTDLEDAEEPTAVPPGLAELTKRLGALTADLKAALAGPDGARVQALLVSVNHLLKDGNAAGAAQALDELERLAKAGADPEQQWLRRFAEVDQRFQAVLRTQPANAGDLRAVMAFANAAAEKGDFAKALVALARLEAALEKAQTLGKETDVIPEGIVQQRVQQLELAAGRWREVHFQSIKGLEGLMQQLRADDDPDLHEIADRVDVLTTEIPAEIEAALAKLSAAVRAGDTAGTAQWAKQVQLGVTRGENFLKANLPAIERCEDNPFDVPVLIQKPVRETLASIRASLAGL
jgi:hypothetical protein